uniref:Uncharacterized protein n=1 Tax=Anguilla anguilla TaxID=7936 RepID=A0A0E9X465_ANGAN
MSTLQITSQKSEVMILSSDGHSVSFRRVGSFGFAHQKKQSSFDSRIDLFNFSLVQPKPVNQQRLKHFIVHINAIFILFVLFCLV